MTLENENITDVSKSDVMRILESISPNKPRINKEEMEILKESQQVLFQIIREKLCSIELSNENIPYAALLASLLSINNEASDKKKERTLKSNLNTLIASNQSNKRLRVILWATQFQTSASLTTLSEMFAFLPTEVQIRCVKKLFQLIEQKKISYTAETLYQLLSHNSEYQLCIPLEIAFAYLKIREKDPKANLTIGLMLEILDKRTDYEEWELLEALIKPCYGRWHATELLSTKWRYYCGLINKKYGSDTIYLYVPRKMVDVCYEAQEYNNKYFNDINEYIGISFPSTEYERIDEVSGYKYIFKSNSILELLKVTRFFNIKNISYNIDNEILFYRDKDWYYNKEKSFCECRQSDNLNDDYDIGFYWCENKPCFCEPIRYRVTSEWSMYSLLDFLRILHIPVDYTNAKGKTIKNGYYIFLATFLNSFATFYDHLKCRECGKPMRPINISNFALRTVTEFSCADINCINYDKIIYLNHCFNCQSIIDSRDSKTCPNSQYICPKCGACCSTENFIKRMKNLRETGGNISYKLEDFVKQKLGHWELGARYCYNCGNQMKKNNGEYHCENCPNIDFSFNTDVIF